MKKSIKVMNSQDKWLAKIIRGKKQTSLKEVNLELKYEGRARQAAEIAQVDLEMSLNDLKIKLNKELNRN